MQFLPYGTQNISEDDIKEVIKCLKSNFITQGPYIKQFEDYLSNYCKSKYAYVLANATCALHLAYLSLNVKQNDIVWTTPNTFLSTSNAALMCGAEIDFVDICKLTYNICVNKLEEKLLQAKKINQIPKVLTVVHYAGQSCDMKKIYNLSKEYGFFIIEDAAHAIGGKYNNENIGSCTYSDLTVFSFHPVKIITTGEGGAITTNSSKIAHKISLLRSHGVSRDECYMTKKPEGSWYYQMLDLGYNYRITDIQCALGLSQIKTIDKNIKFRHKMLNLYKTFLKDFNKNYNNIITLPYQSENIYSSLHLFPIQVPRKIRKKIFDYLLSNNIGVNVHYIPVYMQPFYMKMKKYPQKYCLNAENYYYSTISLPMHTKLNKEKIMFVCEILQKSLIKYLSD